MSRFVAFNIAIFFSAVVGGTLPLLISWSDRVLHLFLALTTGIFLGAVFLHLIPELAHQDPGITSWLLVLGGLLIVYALETLIFPTRYASTEESHKLVGYATLAGLSVHSYADGQALAAGFLLPSLGMPIFLSIVTHKVAETFSLCTVFELAEMSRRKTIVLLGVFSLITPLGAASGYVFFAGSGGPLHFVIPTAIATGTFLYVALCDLMPEVFHRPHDNAAKLFLLLVGAAFMLALRAIE